LYDNARPHTAVSIKQSLAKTRDSRNKSPPSPYSPDLSPSHFLFPKIKSTLKGRRFQDTNDIKGVVGITRRCVQNVFLTIS
jgi:transposase